MENRSLTPQEVADTLKISKCTVYELIKRRELNGYRVGNKVRVDSDDVEEYKNKTKHVKSKAKIIMSEITGPAEFELNQNENSFIICGQDSLLDTLCRYLGHQHNAATQRAYENSYFALSALYRGDIQVAATHMWDGKTDLYNTPYVERLLPGIPAVIIHLAHRIQGFYVVKGNPKAIRGWDDLKRKDITIINREAGSGTRVLLDQHLKIMGLPSGEIKGYTRETFSPMVITGSIVKGHADLGIGIELPFLQTRELEFIPIQHEDYDLVVKKENFGSPIIQAMIQIIQSEDFRLEMHGINGYDLSDAGKIVAET
ncbi:MAG TPA: excisionase [Firmicutes bacterium]|jgi:putative molybdopterin biosynthesis protein|nr:excisionase [Bacillota bacterium]